MGDPNRYDPELCSAFECPVRVGRTVLMCQRHAALIPKQIRQALLDLQTKSDYESGMIRAGLIQACVESVAAAEGKRIPKLPDRPPG